MTSTEDLVRNALADLAPTAPADESAYAGVRRSVGHRIRRRRATRVVAVAALALAVVGGVSLVGGRNDEPSGFSTQPRDDVTTGPDDGASPAPGTGGGEGDAATAAEVQLGPARFEVPAGWEWTEQEGSWLDLPEAGDGEGVQHRYTSMCLRNTTDPGPLDCTLELLHGDVPGHEGFEAYDPDGYWSWYRQSDAMPCPGSDPGARDYVQPVDGDMAAAGRDVLSVGSRTAEYSRWSVVCEQSGFEFSPRAWFLPESELLIIDVLGQPETDAVLASFTFDDEDG